MTPLLSSIQNIFDDFKAKNISQECMFQRFACTCFMSFNASNDKSKNHAQTTLDIINLITSCSDFSSAEIVEFTNILIHDYGHFDLLQQKNPHFFSEVNGVLRTNTFMYEPATPLTDTVKEMNTLFDKVSSLGLSIANLDDYSDFQRIYGSLQHNLLQVDSFHDQSASPSIHTFAALASICHRTNGQLFSPSRLSQSDLVQFLRAELSFCNLMQDTDNISIHTICEHMTLLSDPNAVQEVLQFLHHPYEIDLQHFLQSAGVIRIDPIVPEFPALVDFIKIHKDAFISAIESTQLKRSFTDPFTNKSFSKITL